MQELNATVPILSIVCMGISIAVIVFFPVFFYKAVTKRFKGNFQSLIWGIFAYVLAGMFLTNLIASTSYLLFGKLLSVNTPMFIVINYTVVTSLCVQVGMLILLKILHRKTQLTGNAMLMAVGFGGAEGILMGAGVLLSNLSLAMSINQTGLSQMAENLSEQEAQQMMQLLEPLLTTPSPQYILLGFEQMGMMIFYVCSILLLHSVLVKKAPIWLVGITILGHIVILLPSALYQVNLISNIVLCELIVMILIAGFTGLTYYLMKSYYGEILKNN